MISDLDIYRSANILIKQHGQDAPIHAAMRADKLLEASDLGGAVLAQSQHLSRARRLRHPPPARLGQDETQQDQRERTQDVEG